MNPFLLRIFLGGQPKEGGFLFVTERIVYSETWEFVSFWQNREAIRLCVSIDEVRDDGISLRLAKWEALRATGKKNILPLHQTIALKSSTGQMWQFELVEADFLKGRDISGRDGLVKALFALVKREDTPLELKHRALALLDKQFNAYVYDIYEHGRYGVPVNHDVLFDALSDEVGREAFDAWLARNQEKYQTLSETLPDFRLFHALINGLLRLDQGREEELGTLDSSLTQSLLHWHRASFCVVSEAIADFAVSHEVSQDHLAMARNDYARLLVLRRGGDAIKEIMRYHEEEEWDADSCRVTDTKLIAEGFDGEKVIATLKKASEEGDPIAKSLLR